MMVPDCQGKIIEHGVTVLVSRSSGPGLRVRTLRVLAPVSQRPRKAVAKSQTL